MQSIIDLRRQTAATALGPLAISTWWEKGWVIHSATTGKEVEYSREKLDTRYAAPIQDLNPGSPTFGLIVPLFQPMNPFNRGPL